MAETTLNFSLVHGLFDLLAWASAGVIGFLVTRWRGTMFPPSARSGSLYLPFLLIGSAVGAYALGTLNLLVSGIDGLARSIEGAIVGGVAAVEIYKRGAGLTGRTGARFAAPLAMGVMIGRIGCFLAGLEDFTYGVPTNSPFGHDFGDGVVRHPVQLYESAAMGLFLAAYLIAAARRSAFVLTNGFTLAVGFYAGQRFVWEFLKPYAPVLGPFTVFHLASAGLLLYAAVLLTRAPKSALKPG